MPSTVSSTVVQKIGSEPIPCQHATTTTETGAGTGGIYSAILSRNQPITEVKEKTFHELHKKKECSWQHSGRMKQNPVDIHGIGWCFSTVTTLTCGLQLPEWLAGEF
uniref:Uncharacterized protein n=1 Tax=Laticauda laticaudata TaxID=8630 RepID=A0A8C5S4H8_LATLA